LIDVPKGVEVKVIDGTIQVKGPKGSLTQDYRHAVKIEVKDGKVQTICESRDPKVMALQGLYNSLVSNMIQGVTAGFEKKLEMVGVGYRAAKQGKNLNISIGYSHPVIVEPPDGIELSVEGVNKITVKGIDKQLVGEIAAEIRRIREVEHYKGKGIRYAGERVRKKAGKAAKAAAGAGA
jgi:large subunit ribosomal protein L6